MKLKYLFAFVLAIVFACDNNEDSESKETTLLTLTVDASYPIDNAIQGADKTGDWLIVHSEDGKLLASANFQNNQELQVITNKSAEGDISITHLRFVSFEDGSKSYSLKSYTNIEKGKHLVLKGYDEFPAVTGNFNVSVRDVNSYQYSILTSRLRTLGNNVNWNGGTGILDIQSNTYLGVPKYIASVVNGNQRRYKVLDNVQPVDTYSFSFNDMIPYEHSATFTFPQSNNIALFVYGSDPDLTSASNSYMLDMRFISDATTAIVPEYINVLNNYTTDLVIFYPGYLYTYLNQGSIPEGNSTWPQKSDFNVTEKSLSNFSATASASYIWRRSLWGYQDATNKISVSWYISSPSGNHMIEELPVEIINVHPALALSNLIYNGTTFYTQSPAYELFFNNTLKAEPEPTGLRLGISIDDQ